MMRGRQWRDLKARIRKQRASRFYRETDVSFKRAHGAHDAVSYHVRLSKDEHGNYTHAVSGIPMVYYGT